jgi:hypothetical protein
MTYSKIVDLVAYALRDVHRDLAMADGHSYQPDFGDPRAVEMILNLLAKELESDVHYFDPATDERQQGVNEGLSYAARVLTGLEPCSFD